MHVCGIKCMCVETVGCMYAENVGCTYAGTLGCMYVDFGCMSIKRFGAKYAVVGCKVCGCWVQSMRLLGAKDAVVGCKSMERLGACLTVGSLGPGAPEALDHLDASTLKVGIES